MNSHEAERLRDCELVRLKHLVNELSHHLRVVKTAASRFARGDDNSPTYVLKVCEKAGALLAEVGK